MGTEKNQNRSSRASKPLPVPLFPGQRRSKASSLSRDIYTQADAQWFMRLPNKVQKTQFTKEEQFLLGGRCDDIFPDAAEDVCCQLGPQRNRSVPSLDLALSSCRSSISSIEEDYPIDSESDMEESILHGFRWMEDDDDLDLALDDYHKHIAPITNVSKKPTFPRPSFRRNLSLTNLPLASTNFGSSNKVPLTQPSPQAIKSARIPPWNTPSRTHAADPIPLGTGQKTVPTMDTSAKHYQDPEARLKLRVYLASPQKFDEAVEFGFPSLDEEEMPIPSLHLPPKYQYPDLGFQNVSYDDNHSFFDGSNGGHDASLTESDRPKTPLTPTFGDTKRRPTRKLLPKISNDPLPRYRPAYVNDSKFLDPCIGTVFPGAREMTLRMTLTRPDLRGDENASTALSADPLALEQLPRMEARCDIWEKQNGKDGVVKRLWSKMSGKI